MTTNLTPTAATETAAILKKKKTKRKLPVRNIIDAELVLIDNKKNNSHSPTNARDMDNLLIPTERDRTILSDLWNNTITTGRPSNSDKPRVILGTPTTKKIRPSNTITAMEENKVVSRKKDIYKERLISHHTVSSDLDFSGHTIIPFKLAQNMSNKVAKEKAQQQEDNHGSDENRPTYDFDQIDTADLSTQHDTNIKQDTHVDLCTNKSNDTTSVVEEAVKDMIVQAQQDIELEADKENDNKVVDTIASSPLTENASIEKKTTDSAATSQIETTVAQVEITENAVLVVVKGTDRVTMDNNKDEKTKVDQELHESKLTPTVPPCVVVPVQEAKQMKKSVRIFIGIHKDDEEEITTATDIPRSNQPADQLEEEKEDKDEGDTGLENDDQYDNQQEDVYQKIYELMSCTKRKATATPEEIERPKKETRCNNKASDWFSCAADAKDAAKGFSSQDKKKIKARKIRLFDKLDQPYITKKKIKSVWFVADVN